jgi:capsule biosynthesis phosphatase
MKVIVLCGGSGTRMNNYSLPKPLNYIYGTPAITFCLQNLPATVTELFFIVSSHLLDYSFEEVIKKEFKTKKCSFYILPYFTRGPIESAYLGVKGVEFGEEPVVFLDNDVLYRFPEGMFTHTTSAFLGYSKDTTGSEAYSFIQRDSENKVIEYKEKKRISDEYVCGIYGFKSIQQFKEIASYILNSPITTELYMSLCYQELLRREEEIHAFYIQPPIYHIGSLHELTSSFHNIPKKKMRVCFDLDNTLVSYPTVPGDYSTVKPIASMISLLNKLHKEGHVIIIHTARRMETHRHNVGAVIKDIARITLDTLEKFNIPYDELLFGKPIADIYIDDRAVNPQFQSIETMGYITNKESKKPINYLGNNKYNSIEVKNNRVIKRGPYSVLKGEIFYYENIPKNSLISSYFPTLYSTSKGEIAQLELEYIHGIPLYTLYKNRLFTKEHLNTLFEYLDILHNLPGDLPSQEIVVNNYSKKLKGRFEDKTSYPFENAEVVQKACLELLDKYTSSPLHIVPFIHGDFWLSNIFIGFDNKIKVFDMKGQLDDVCTTGGDRMYDYAKLFQSILGYDAVLYGDSLSDDYIQENTGLFFEALEKRGLSSIAIKGITFSLVLGTLYFIEKEEVKHRVWEWMCRTFKEFL